MSRALDSSLSAALSNSSISPILLADLTFKSGVVYAWSGIGSILVNGHTYTGVGTLGRITPVSEGSDIKADGMELTLGGIGVTPLTLNGGGSNGVQLVNETLSDYQIGGPAKVWFGLISNGVLIGNPYLLFSGQMDQPSVNIDTSTSSITIALENKLSNLLRPTARRYTAADQHLLYPDDIGFNWVEILNDVSLKWGTP